MTNVEINVTGKMEDILQKNVDDKPLELPSIRIPIAQLGYPRAQEWIQHETTTIRPWSVFLNLKHFRLPPFRNFSRLRKRLLKNLEYFKSNYFVLFVGLIIFCLLTSPLLLLIVAAAVFTCYKASKIYSKHVIKIKNYTVTLDQIHILIFLCLLPLLYVFSAAYVIFWSLGVTLCLVGFHAFLYNVDLIISSEEEESNLVMHEV